MTETLRSHLRMYTRRHHPRRLTLPQVEEGNARQVVLGWEPHPLMRQRVRLEWLTVYLSDDECILVRANAKPKLLRGLRETMVATILGERSRKVEDATKSPIS